MIYGDANKQFLTLNLNLFCHDKKSLSGTRKYNLPTKNCRSPYLSPRKYHMYGMGWIGKISCIPGHLALEVFIELRNSSVLGIWGWKQTGIVCLGHLISHSCQRGSFCEIPSDFSGTTSLESCFECLWSEYIFLVFTLEGAVFSCSVVVFIPRISPR